MPGYDKTGPAGLGAMTGRAAGLCCPSEEERSDERGIGRGRGCGLGRGRGGGRGNDRGRGMGRRNRFYQQPAGDQQADALGEQVEQLAASLDDIRKRIDNLTQEKK